MAIAQRERAALAKIIDARFKILANELATRRQRVAEVIRERMYDDAQRGVAEATERMEALMSEADAFNKRVAKEVKAIERSLKVTPGRLDKREQWADATHTTTKVVYRLQEITPLRISMQNEWAPINLDKQINDELRRLGVEHDEGGRSLEAIKLDLHEKLLLGEVQSEGARAFLDEIPTAEKLLPLPDGYGSPALNA